MPIRVWSISSRRSDGIRNSLSAISPIRAWKRSFWSARAAVSPSRIAARNSSCTSLSRITCAGVAWSAASRLTAE